MPYRHCVQQDGELLVVVIEGALTAKEEREALLDTVADPDLAPGASVLVDRTRAQLTVGPEQVEEQVELAQGVFTPEGRPRMALVVASDRDERICSMLAEHGLAPHEIRVFRSVEAACQWLGFEPGDIDWP
jgi:hypothetical protein